MATVKRQTTIQSMFAAPRKPTAVATTVTPTVPSAAADGVDTSILTSTDPDVQAFYDSLSSRERIAHAIAIDKLGTSYDVVRTHGFQKWMRARGGGL
jgi:hypothetical protein